MGILTNHTGEPLTRDQTEQLIAGVREKAHRSLLILGLSSGISKEEICQITPDVIHYQNQIINIWDKFQDRHRSVYISSKVLEILKEYERISVGNVKLFPYATPTIDDTVRKYSQEILNMPKTWLSIRRTYVQLCVQVGMPMAIVVENTGGKVQDIHKYYAKQTLNPVQEVNTRLLFQISQRRLI